jgi:hypothetical protein
MYLSNKNTQSYRLPVTTLPTSFSVAHIALCCLLKLVLPVSYDFLNHMRANLAQLNVNCMRSLTSARK